MAWQNMLPGPVTVGQDVPQIANMLANRDQQNRQNQLADIAMQRQDMRWNQEQGDRQQEEKLRSAWARIQQAKGAPPEVQAQVIAQLSQEDPEFGAVFGRMPPEQAIQHAEAGIGAKLGMQPQQPAAPRYTQVGDSLLEVPTKSGETPRVAFTAPQKPAGTGTLYKVQTPNGPRYVTAEEARGLPPAEDAPAAPTPKSAMQLRKEFEAQPEVKDFKVILPQLVAARKAPDTGAGDLQIVYTVAKLLDPQSVVRESETAMVLQSVNPISRIVGAGRFNFEGKGRLEPKIRAQLLSMLNERALATRQQYDAARRNFDEYAQQSGFDRQWVTGTHPAASIDPSARLGAAPARQEAPPSAVEFLRKNPQTKAAFKAKYGYLP